MVYGNNNEDLLPDDTSDPADAVVGDPGDDQSLARLEDGVDTNSVEDWFLDATPTPGATNVTEGGNGDDDVPGTGCGCNRGEPKEGEPNDGGGCGGPPDGMAATSREPTSCATLPLPFGGPEIFALLVALCRRRRDA